MLRFTCSTCGNEAPFDADQCHHCGTQLGYLPEQRELCAVRSAAGGYTTPDDSTVWWRCLNHAWGCNWMIPSRSDNVWCASCRLTRGRPDTADPDAVDAWSHAERVKRRLVDQLLALRLPLEPTRPGEPRLVFDLLYLPDGAGATGHQHGVVTLDLREIDDTYRDRLRRQLTEPYRTVIGHLRHETGHHYWPILVTGPEAAGEFRVLFGDERADYPAALEAHYASPPTRASSDHISTYAMAHPAEDWAETFAHYLHLRDGLETAHQHGLSPPTDHEDITAILAAWQQLTTGLNQIDEGLGLPPTYPFRITDRVADKLAFLHHQLQQHWH